MAVRPIRIFGDPVLSQVCAPIGDIDDGVRALVQDLIDTVEVPGRAGVAAPQIGVPVRAFSVNVDGFVACVLDPVLAETRGELELMDEGCLSVPELGFPTPRYPWARTTGRDVDGNPVEIVGEGLLAEALQHEQDHLDGVVYLRRLERETRREAMAAVRRSAWLY